nr:hypothetical protein [uncultured Methanospirillum sp.]
MAPKCTICTHNQREAIERAIISGVPIRIIADQYGISLGAINRHKDSHMTEALAKSREIALEMGESRASTLMAVTMSLLQQSQDITAEARGAGDLKTALMGIGKTSDLISLLVRVATEMKAMQEEENKSMPPPESGENITWIDMSKVEGLSDDELLILDRAVKSLAP